MNFIDILKKTTLTLGVPVETIHGAVHNEIN